MAEPAAKWQESLHVDVISDYHVTGKHGFELWGDCAEVPQVITETAPIFESGLVYSTRRDAEQAGDDAAHAAWKWRNM